MKKHENLRDGATRPITSEERTRRDRRERYENEVASTDREELRAKWRDSRKSRLENMTPAELEEFREKNRAYQREYYKKNADAAKARAAKRRIDKADEVANYNRAYRAAHLEECREKERQQKQEYRAANREQISAQRKEYRAAHKEAIAEYQKAYYQANKEKLAENQRRRRQAKKDMAAQNSSSQET